jgi:hypothetical protein
MRFLDSRWAADAAKSVPTTHEHSGDKTITPHPDLANGAHIRPQRARCMNHRLGLCD